MAWHQFSLQEVTVHSQVGAHVRTPTPEQEARASHFKKLRKGGHYRKPWLPIGEYIMLKQKGGEPYARTHPFSLSRFAQKDSCSMT